MTEHRKRRLVYRDPWVWAQFFPFSWLTLALRDTSTHSGCPETWLRVGRFTLVWRHRHV